MDFFLEICYKSRILTEEVWLTGHTDATKEGCMLMFRNCPSLCQLEYLGGGRKEVRFSESVLFLGGRPQSLPFAWLAAHAILDQASGYSVLFCAH